MRSPVRKKGSAQVVNVSELIVLGVVIGFKDMSVVEMAKTSCVGKYLKIAIGSRCTSRSILTMT